MSRATTVLLLLALSVLATNATRYYPALCSGSGVACYASNSVNLRIRGPGKCSGSSAACCSAWAESTGYCMDSDEIYVREKQCRSVSVAADAKCYARAAVKTFSAAFADVRCSGRYATGCSDAKAEARAIACGVAQSIVNIAVDMGSYTSQCSAAVEATIEVIAKAVAKSQAGVCSSTGSNKLYLDQDHDFGSAVQDAFSNACAVCWVYCDSNGRSKVQATGHGAADFTKDSKVSGGDGGSAATGTGVGNSGSSPADGHSTPTTPSPVNPAPVDPSPVNPAPVDPSPVNPAPVDPSPVNPAPGKPYTPEPGNPAPVDPSPVDPAPGKPYTPEPGTGGSGHGSGSSHGGHGGGYTSGHGHSGSSGNGGHGYATSTTGYATKGHGPRGSSSHGHGGRPYYSGSSGKYSYGPGHRGSGRRSGGGHYSSGGPSYGTGSHGSGHGSSGVTYKTAHKHTNHHKGSHDDSHYHKQDSHTGHGSGYGTKPSFHGFGSAIKAVHAIANPYSSASKGAGSSSQPHGHAPPKTPGTGSHYPTKPTSGHSYCSICGK